MQWKKASCSFKEHKNKKIKNAADAIRCVENVMSLSTELKDGCYQIHWYFADKERNSEVLIILEKTGLITDLNITDA